MMKGVHAVGPWQGAAMIVTIQNLFYGGDSSLRCDSSKNKMACSS